MAYTPELTRESSCNLRRLAWALGIPMTEAIQTVFTEILPQTIENKVICKLCRDNTRCESCGFNAEKNNRNFIFTIEENRKNQDTTDKKNKRTIKRKYARRRQKNDSSQRAC